MFRAIWKVGKQIQNLNSSWVFSRRKIVTVKGMYSSMLLSRQPFRFSLFFKIEKRF